MYVCTYIHIYYIYVYTSIIYIYTSVYIYICIHTHSLTHTHIHIYRRRYEPLSLLTSFFPIVSVTVDEYSVVDLYPLFSKTMSQKIDLSGLRSQVQVSGTPDLRPQDLTCVFLDTLTWDPSCPGVFLRPHTYRWGPGLRCRSWLGTSVVSSSPAPSNVGSEEDRQRVEQQNMTRIPGINRHNQVGKTYQKQHSAREICITLMFVSCVKFQRFFTVSLPAPSTCLGCPSKRTIL